MVMCRCLSLSAAALLFCLIGCSPKSTSQGEQIADEAVQPRSDGPLRILVLDDAELSSILQREWRAGSEHPVEVTELSTNDLLDQLDGGKQRLETDVVIFPSALLGQLAEQKLLRPLTAEVLDAAEYQRSDVFDLIRRRETKWNQRPFAVPFGSPTLVLLSRPDVVSEPPSTWTELNETVRALEASIPDGMVPLAQPMADGWASRNLLMRAACYLYDSSRVSSVFDYATMQPRVASPPFETALDELAKSFPGGSPTDLTPATSLDAFLQGRAAMAITWLSASSTAHDLDFPVEVTPLPGSSRRYSPSDKAWKDLPIGETVRVTVLGTAGRLGGVSRSAKNASVANRFLAWATGQASGELCSRSRHTAPFRKSHMPNAAAWAAPAFTAEVAKRYAEIVEESLSRAEAMQCPRLPGQHKYLAAMDSAVRSVVSDGMLSKDALVRLTDDWNDITAKLGLESQSKAYRASLGIQID